MSAEAKVGLFFLIALVLVGTIALYLGDFWVRARSYPVTAYFENVQGLPSGAEVRFAGVRVGRVTSVNLEPSPKHPRRPAAVKMDVFHDTILYNDDEFIVQQSALLGDKYVEVKRVAVKPQGRLVAGSEVEGGKTVGIEQITDEARGLIKEARATLVAVRGMLANQYNEAAIHQILANVLGATGKANVLASQALQLTNILAKNAAQAGPNVVQLVANLKDASLSVKSTAHMVQSLLTSSPIPRDMGVASGNIRRATDDMAAMSSNMAKVLADPEMRVKIQSALDNLHQSTENMATLTGQAAKLFDDNASRDIRDTLTRMREAATNISNISATYDTLLTDPAFTADLRGTVTAARSAAEAGSRAIQKAESSLNRVDETMARVTTVTRAFTPEEVRASVSLEGSRPGGLRADVKADLQYGTKHNSFWRVGIRDVGDAETLILQRAVPIGADRFRAGIYANKAGIGYDVTPQARSSVEVDLWNPNDPRLDLRGSFGLTSHVDALLGFNDVGSETEPFVGVRYRSNPGR